MEQLERIKWLGPIVAIGLTALALSPTLFNGFVNWDDGAYVLNNYLIRDWSLEGVQRMFSTPEVAGSWHPLTLLSLAGNYQLWGLAPFGYHLVNLLLHLLCVWLVFAFVRQISNNRTIASVTALLFGIHPMHVESVAWVSGRKDVLYAAFLLGSLLYYAKYVQASDSKQWRHYAIAVVLCAASMLSKGMAMVIPGLLIVLDLLLQRKKLLTAALDKIPYVVMAVLLMLATLHGQDAGGATSSLNHFPIQYTAFVGGYNVMWQLYHAIVPIGLSSFHPYEFLVDELPTYVYVLAVLSAVVFAFAAWLGRNDRRCWFAAGFFLISLLPVLQIVPFGMAISAERYSYVAYIGLFFGAAHGLVWLGKRFNQSAVWALFALVVVGFCVQSAMRSTVWKDGTTLWANVLESYPENAYAHYNYGFALQEQQQFESALQQYHLSIQLDSTFGPAWYAKGQLEENERPNQALQSYKQGIAHHPTFPKNWMAAGMFEWRVNKDFAEAERLLRSAVAQDSTYALAWINLGALLEVGNNPAEAQNCYSAAIANEPLVPTHYKYRAVGHLRLGNWQAAEDDLTTAIQLDPDYGQALGLRAKLYLQHSRVAEARQDAQRAAAAGYTFDPTFWKKLEPLTPER